MTAPSLPQRVGDLEAEAYRNIRRHEQIHTSLEALTGATAHLTNAVGDLSQGQRAMAFDIREINGRLDHIETDVSMLKTDVSMLKTDMAAVKGTLVDHGRLLQLIAEHLGVAGN